MVCNGTYSGMNTSLWDPHFAPHMVGSTIPSVQKGTFMADRDIGDMLLNLMLSEELIPFCGVYVMNVCRYEEWQKDIIRRW